MLTTQETAKFTVRPLPAALGAEVTGIDLSRPVDAATRKALYDAWVKHAVLVIRGQKLTPGQFADAAGIFGELLEQQIKKYALPENPLVGTISSRDLPLVDGKLHVRGENYHTDHSNFAAPPKATTLHAVSLPSQGGDTQFVDVRKAYDDLPEETKRKILPLRSPHVYESSHSPRKMTALSAEERAKIPQTLQPLVIRHPDSGRPALYLNTARMEGIEGMGAGRGVQAHRRAVRPRHAVEVRVPPQVAARRHGDLGQPQRHAPGEPGLRPVRVPLSLPHHAERRAAAAGRLIANAGTAPRTEHTAHGKAHDKQEQRAASSDHQPGGSTGEAHLTRRRDARRRAPRRGVYGAAHAQGRPTRPDRSRSWCRSRRAAAPTS